jgi:hypothetical protein
MFCSIRRGNVLRRSLLLAAIGASFTALGQQTASSNDRLFFTDLNGLKEVPSAITTGTGRAEVQISSDGMSLRYEVSYSKLSSPVTQSHIHIAQRRVNGGIMVYLCDNTGKAPSGVPACPNSGSVSGTIIASDVNPPNDPEPTTTQGIPPGDLAGVISAIESGVAYVNVHTTIAPSGEIRGQLRADKH